MSWNPGQPTRSVSRLRRRAIRRGTANRGRPASQECRAREVLQRVGDKWSMYVIDLLGRGTMRFTELHRGVDGITARMLTVTLRGLERDGIVTGPSTRSSRRGSSTRSPPWGAPCSTPSASW